MYELLAVVAVSTESYVNSPLVPGIYWELALLVVLTQTSYFAIYIWVSANFIFVPGLLCYSSVYPSQTIERSVAYFLIQYYSHTILYVSTTTSLFDNDRRTVNSITVVDYAAKLT